MMNEELIAQAISVLNEILKSETVVKVNVEVDSDWDDGMESLDISVKYYPKKEEAKEITATDVEINPSNLYLTWEEYANLGKIFGKKAQ